MTLLDAKRPPVRVTAIWVREVGGLPQAAPVDWRPQAPNATSAPRVAWPARRPFIILRYLTLFGLSMACPSFP